MTAYALSARVLPSQHYQILRRLFEKVYTTSTNEKFFWLGVTYNFL